MASDASPPVTSVRHLLCAAAPHDARHTPHLWTGTSPATRRRLVRGCAHPPRLRSVQRSSLPSCSCCATPRWVQASRFHPRHLRHVHVHSHNSHGHNSHNHSSHCHSHRCSHSHRYRHRHRHRHRYGHGHSLGHSLGRSLDHRHRHGHGHDRLVQHHPRCRCIDAQIPATHSRTVRVRLLAPACPPAG